MYIGDFNKQLDYLYKLIKIINVQNLTQVSVDRYTHSVKWSVIDKWISCDNVPHSAIPPKEGLDWFLGCYMSHLWIMGQFDSGQVLIRYQIFNKNQFQTCMQLECYDHTCPNSSGYYLEGGIKLCHVIKAFKGLRHSKYKNVRQSHYTKNEVD